jgi:hypothetical protein
MFMFFKIFKPFVKVSAVAALMLLGSVQITVNTQAMQGWVSASFSEAAADSNRRVARRTSRRTSNRN